MSVVKIIITLLSSKFFIYSFAIVESIGWTHHDQAVQFGSLYVYKRTYLLIQNYEIRLC